MQKNILHIIWVFVFLGFVSMAYYLSLLPGLPFVVIVLLVAAFGYLSYRWISKNITTQEPVIMSRAHTNWSYAVLLAGVIVVTNKTWYLETKYGYWDSWTVWNYHARFLQYPEYWKRLFYIDLLYHPDYPLYLPGTIAFFRRLTCINSAIIPFTFSYMVALLVPVSIFLALYRKNLPVATLVFMLIATDDFYLERGVAHYADVPLGLLFLFALICLEQVRKQAAVVLLTAALLGCCAWMKNEGIMLAGIFIVFNLRDLFAGGRWKYFFAGIAFPVLTLIVFKSSVPATDIIAGQSVKTSQFLTDWSRYAITWQYLGDNFNHNYVAIKLGLMVYAVFCFAEKKAPGRELVILLCCTLGYCMVYVMTPKGIEWHLQTSMDRVLLQVMPGFMYVLALRFCNLRFSLADKQLH